MEDSQGPKGSADGGYTSLHLQTERARYLFLQAVRRRCPLPLFHLRTRVFPLYGRWVDRAMLQASAEREWGESPEAAELRRESVEVFKRLGLTEPGAQLAAEGRPPAGLEANAPLFKAFIILEDAHPGLSRCLMLWAQRHNLTHRRELEEDPPRPEERSCDAEDETEIPTFIETTLHRDYWACQWALSTLWSWKFLAEGPQMMYSDPPEWVRNPFQTGPSDDPIFRLRPGWDVLSETEKGFRVRAKKALDTYIQNKRRLAEAGGLMVTTQKRRLIHFDWLALYQVKKWSFRKIDDWGQTQLGEHTMDADVIRKGIESAANSCGLRARPVPRGRPKNRK